MNGFKLQNKMIIIYFNKINQFQSFNLNQRSLNILNYCNKMTDPRRRVGGAANQQATAVEVPVLAYSAGKGEMEGMNVGREPNSQLMDAYNIQMRDNPPSKLSQNNVSSSELHRHNNDASAFSNAAASANVGGAASGQSVLVTNNNTRGGEASTPQAQLPDKILDPKAAPTFTGTMPSNALKQQQRGTTEILSSSDPNMGGQQPVQNVFQFNLRVNNNNMNGSGILVGTSSDSNPRQHNRSTGTAGTGGKGSRASKDRRPMSSKHHPKHNNWQLQSQVHQQNSLNPYLRDQVKRRPQSANRKTLVGIPARLQQPTASYKSPARRKQNQGVTVTSHPTQKGRMIHHFQNNPNLLSSETLSPEETQLGHSGGPAPVIAAGNFHPTSAYNRSLKTNSGALNATSKTYSAHKGPQNYPTSIFGSPDKPGASGATQARPVKSKIPTMTLQSREDLYEQNMQTKMHINTLKNENRKINTKLHVLENQLAQKDKLFEDMYKAAFQQVRLPFEVGAGRAANTGNVGYPQHASVGGSQGGASSATGHSKVVYSAVAAGMAGERQSHAQAQQLINSYKRTIREQSRELDKRDMEVEQIKRSVKMTQINQVLVENENYRKECIRLRERLENEMWMQRQHQTSKITAPGKDTLELDKRNESATETFKRDLTSAEDLAATANREEERERVIEELREQNANLTAEKQELSKQLASSNQATEAKAQEVESLKANLAESQNNFQKAKAQLLDTRRSKDQAQESIQSEIELHHRREVEEIKESHSQKQKELTASHAQKQQELIEQHQQEIEKLREEQRSAMEKVEAERQADASMLAAQAEELDRLRAEVKQHEEAQERQRTLDAYEAPEETAQVQSLEEQLALENARAQSLEKQVRELSLAHNAGEQELNKQKTEKQELTQELEKKRTLLHESDLQLQRALSKAEQRAQMLAERETESQALAERVSELEKGPQTGTESTKLASRVKALELELQYKENALKAQEFEHQKAMLEQKTKVEQLTQQLTAAEGRASALDAQQALQPAIPSGHRGTAQSKQSNKSVAAESSFERQSYEVSCANGGGQDFQVGADQSEDRSDLGFTSDENADPETVAEPSGESEEVDRTPKIQLNDKTMFAEGLPLSPKEVTADSPSVKEGLLRLRHACQVKQIRQDQIENFLFGNEYRPEQKLSIRFVKETAIRKLQMEESAALDFARYLIEASGQSITREGFNADGGIDQERSKLGVNIILSIQQQILPDLIYFRQEKEDKMKLIIGEKLQNEEAKHRILVGLARQEQTGNLLSEQDLNNVFKSAGFNYSKETILCCFIYLLKKRQDLLNAHVNDLKDFVRMSVGKAHDLTKTGSNFPIETELAYDYSESESEMADDIQRDETAGATIKSIMSADAAATKAKAEQQKQQEHITVHRQQSDEPPVIQNHLNQNAAAEQDEYSSDDDDFGANESRSEYSGHPIQEEIETNVNDDNIAVEEEPKRDAASHLAVNSQKASVNIEDSLNDRDLESSIHTKMNTNTSGMPKPLSQVPEVEEHKEVTIEKEQPQASLKVKLDPSNEAKIIENLYSNEQDQKVNELEALTIVQRQSKSLQPTEEDEMIKTQGPARGKSEQAVESVQEPVRSNTLGSLSSSARKKRPNVKIDVAAAQEKAKQIQDQSQPQSVKSSNASVGPQKISPKVTIKDEDANFNMGSQNSKGEEEVSEIELDHTLVALKPDVPPPPGIFVAQVQHSEYSQKDRKEDAAEEEEYSDDVDDLLENSLDQVQPAAKAVPKEEDATQEENKKETEPTAGLQIDQDGGILGMNEAQLLEQFGSKPNQRPRTVKVETLVTEQSDEAFQLEVVEGSSIEVVQNQQMTASQESLTKADQSAHNLSMPNTAARLADDSFGQPHSSQASPEKTITTLPPLELLQLKAPAQNPAGIQVNALLTEQSRRNHDEGESSVDQAAYDAMGAQKDSEEDQYSEDDEFVNNSEVNTEEQKQSKGAKGSAAPRISVDDEDDDYEF